jgi:hypothetical protein
MPSKPLKVNVPILAESVEAAIAELSQQFLRPGRGSVKVVQDPTDVRVADLCRALIEDWKSGKVAFSKGEIGLTFTSGKLSQEADLLVFVPEMGDRLLYSGRALSSAAPQQLPIAGLADDQIAHLVQPIQTVAEILAELTANQRAVESRLQQLLEQIPIQKTAADGLSGQSDEAIAEALSAQTASFTQQLQTALEAQAATFAQILSSQVTANSLHFNKRLDAVQAQLDQLASQLRELETLEPEPLPIPQTESEWLSRINATWGTVGDYEQYSLSHRIANAETPLFHTPDWVVLCELDWVRKLHPTLMALYELIYGDKGIGYGGADILQQFGRHIDPQTSETYYVYHMGGFTAYDALWQTVRDPQNSWLPDLQQLLNRIGNRHSDIFELFGWEVDAIASLESVVKRAVYEQQSGRQSSYNPHPSSHKEYTISDYLAILNIGPFTPVSVEVLKRAYKQAMKTAHPDTGGSTEQAQQINEAYEALLQHYFPQAT